MVFSTWKTPISCAPHCVAVGNAVPREYVMQSRSIVRLTASVVTIPANSAGRENRSFLLAIDLFNHGYYWEAHEEWDRLLRASGNESTVGRFLKGLVKMAAAGVKVREHSIHGVRRHAASAGEVFADVSAECESE